MGPSRGLDAYCMHPKHRYLNLRASGIFTLSLVHPLVVSGHLFAAGRGHHFQILEPQSLPCLHCSSYPGPRPLVRRRKHIAFPVFSLLL